MDIQVGDRVTYINKEGIKKEIIVYDYYIWKSFTTTFDKASIIKIERPKYEVVEEKKELLTEKEREYLSNVIKPFKNKVGSIEKRKWDKKEYIHIYIVGEIGIDFPSFKPNTMYKGMKLKKEYTLSEVGLEEI